LISILYLAATEITCFTSLAYLSLYCPLSSLFTYFAIYFALSLYPLEGFHLTLSIVQQVLGASLLLMVILMALIFPHESPNSTNAEVYKCVLPSLRLDDYQDMARPTKWQYASSATFNLCLSLYGFTKFTYERGHQVQNTEIYDYGLIINGLFVLIGALCLLFYATRRWNERRIFVICLIISAFVPLIKYLAPSISTPISIVSMIVSTLLYSSVSTYLTKYALCFPADVSTETLFFNPIILMQLYSLSRYQA
jgi:hypothetical protein